MNTPLAILLDASGRRRATLVAVPGVLAGQEDLPRVSPDRLQKMLDFENPIRSARIEAGLSQVELAAAMGVSQPLLSKLEQAGREPTPRARARAQAAIAALMESRRIWEASPQSSLEDLEAAQAPLLALAQARKARDPEERALLRRAKDPVVKLEEEGRVKASGARAQRPVSKGPRGSK